MDVFAGVKEDVKKKIAALWLKMSQDEKDHFINQISLALSIWGGDDKGTKFVLDILERMVADGSHNLADFGLYIESALKQQESSSDRWPKIRRASLIIDDYRMKNSLPSEPSKDLGI